MVRTVDYRYMWEFSLALVQAVRCDDLWMMQWILQHFCDCPVEKGAVEEELREVDVCGFCSCWKRTLYTAGLSVATIAAAKYRHSVRRRRNIMGDLEFTSWLLESHSHEQDYDREDEKRLMSALTNALQRNMASWKWSSCNGDDTGCCGWAWTLRRSDVLHDVDVSQRKKRKRGVWNTFPNPEGGTTTAMDEAAANGNFELIKWLHENTTARCSQKAMDPAAGRGRLDIVKWLRENHSEGCSLAAMDNAATGEYLMNYSARCKRKELHAAGLGGLDAVKWVLRGILEKYTPKRCQKNRAAT
ncbi:hypothetical protein ON010_g9957 [Phytophthora cinnamomi]|nr:hypothetical protein ON010_g9957 [Phytophthora cinnamomi]